MPVCELADRVSWAELRLWVRYWIICAEDSKAYMSLQNGGDKQSPKTTPGRNVLKSSNPETAAKMLHGFFSRLEHRRKKTKESADNGHKEYE